MEELIEGRPADYAERAARERRVYDLLDSLGVAYQRLDHPAAENMEVCAMIDHHLHAVICKNLFLCNRQKTRFFLLMMPGDKKFLTKDLSHQIEAPRLSFAGPEEMLSLLDTEPGSVSVMGLMNDHEGRVQLLIDEDVLAHEYVGCHPCANTTSMRLRVADLLEKVLPAINHSPKTVVL